MAKLNQLAIDSKSEPLSEQVFLYVEREMERELRMTRILIVLFHEVTDAVRDKAKVIEEVKELGVAGQYVGVGTSDDLDYNSGYLYNNGTLDVEFCGDCSMLVSEQVVILISI
nr:hypothetical protein [Tanacetum cinerariifolium]